MSVLEGGYDLAQTLVIAQMFAVLYVASCPWLAFLLCAGKEVKRIPLASCEHLPLCVGVW